MVVLNVPLANMTHADLINLWPTIVAFAGDIGVNYEAAKGMRRRGSVPSGYWRAMVVAARERGIEGVTYERLAEMAAITREAAE